MTAALCRTRPQEFWWTGDYGNRLALLLCGACPYRARCAGQNPEPYGVIVAGVAYGDRGERLAVCHCGYPQTNLRPDGCCRWCSVTTLPAMPKPLYDRLRVYRSPRPRRPRQVRPCGTPAAAWRHRKRREPMCAPCRTAERAHDSARKRDRRLSTVSPELSTGEAA